MAIIELVREIKGQELIDIIKETSKEQGFNFAEPGKYSQLYSVYKKCPESDPFQGLAFDTTPSLSFVFEDLRPEDVYQKLYCITEVSTMIRNPVELEGDYAKYKPHFDQFIDRINEKLTNKK